MPRIVKIMTEERYEIRGKIGQGGVGAVYKAYDTQLRREVAIKRVLADEDDAGNDQATQNLLKEATALSSVQHPHICTVYDAGIDEEGPFVVMELIKGKTLDMMVEKGTLTYEDFREVAIQSQEAMIAAQELNIVHRDLKPSNVMVSRLPSGRFQIKLVDFGLAKFSAKPSLQTIDHGDAVFGSIFFMAPEQFERTPLDQRTDMYSLGAMFYYTLTGNYPFDGDSAPQVMASHLQNSVIPLQHVRPDLPIWLCEWVMWHIQKDMNHRPNSAKDALDKFLSDESLASQGALGATQQLVTPAAPRSATSPLFIVPGVTGPQTIQAGGTITSPLANISPNQLPANPLLQGQVRTVTGPQAVQPGQVRTVTGPQPVQPGQIRTVTGPQPILTPAGSPSTHTSPHAISPHTGPHMGTTTAPLLTGTQTGPLNTGAPQQQGHATPPPFPGQAPQAPQLGQPQQLGQPPQLGQSQQPGQPPQLGQPQQLGQAPQLGQTQQLGQPAQAEHQEAAPQMSAEEEAQFLASQKQPMSKQKKNMIFSVLGGLILLSIILLFMRSGSNEETETYNRVIKGVQRKADAGEAIPVTRNELLILLKSIEGPAGKNRNAALLALTIVESADDSFSAPLITSQFASNREKNLTENSRKRMFEATSFNKPYSTEAYKTMLEYAKMYPDEACSEQAVGQVTKMPIDAFFDDILAIHNTTTSLPAKTKCVNMMTAIIKQSKKKADHSKKLVSSYKSSSDKVEKLSYIRIMGSTGSDEALALLTEALKDKDPITVQAATRGFANWPNLKPADALIEAYANSTRTSSKIRKDIMSFLSMNEKASDADKIDIWKKLIKAAPDNREMRQIVGRISMKGTPVTKAVMEFVIEQPNMDEKSKDRAIDTLEELNKPKKKDKKKDK